MNILFVFAFFLHSLFALNIFVYNPRFSYSHAKFLDKISDVLVDAGHNVTQLVPITDRRLREGETKATRITFNISDEVFNNWATLGDDINGNMWRTKASDYHIFPEMIKRGTRSYSAQCAEILSNVEVMDILRSSTFDIALSEPFDMCGLALIQYLKIEKYITVLGTLMTTSIAMAFGVHRNPTYVPADSTDYSDSMDILQRIDNMRASYGLYFSEGIARDLDNAVRPFFGFDYRETYRQLQGSSLVFYNANPYMDFPVPKIEKFIAIGGISADTSKANALDQKWNKLLSLRPRTVLFSFGSIVDIGTMPDDYKKSVVAVMKSFPDATFIWKSEKAESFGVSLDQATVDTSNIVVVPWTPQGDLLADSRLTAFITHGGLGSITEGTTAGKSLLVMPFFADQFHNARMAERAGGAIYYDKTEMNNEEKLREAIDRLLNEESLHQNAALIGEMSRNRPFSPSEIIVRNVEFTAKYGPFKRMNPATVEMPLWKIYMLDVVILFLCSVFVIAFVGYRIICFLLNKCGISDRMKNKLD